MPVWWGKKSSKTKEDQNPYGSYHHSLVKSTVKSKGKDKDKARSFDEVSAAILSRNSPGGSRDLGGGGFSGFDSDGGGGGGGGEKRGHPLPRPSMQGLGHDQGGGLGSGSVSVSSVSSSGSSDDHAVSIDQGQLLLGGFRGNGDIKFNARAKSPCPGSRGPTSPTSPLHPRLSGMNLDSPTGRQEDGRCQSHQLPLPPGSSTSPSALPYSRTVGVTENTPYTLSKWKKGKLLGRGTFGHVYLGFNSEGGQMCAIKEVRAASDDQTSKECFKQLNQEINLLSQLSHPNIVRYYGSELGEETLSVYLEYVSGGSIHKLLQEYGAFKEPVIQNYTRQILSGLAYLHGRNTVHRDIKGANILVGPNGEIKLADFGMAKHITNCCSMLSFKGSPYWMAPEVVMNTNGYSLAVDIWSLGCTVLEMALSKPPWSQYEGVAAIFKIGNSKDIPEIPDHLSNDAKSFVKLCLQRDPSARPTASQLLDHPFIRDQATTRVTNINVPKDVFTYASDGSRTSPTLELRSNRMALYDGDYTAKPAVTNSRALMSSRENVRTIMSLPVSPCASPLRQYGPAHKSCFLSPPHPTFATMGQSGYNFNDYLLYPRPKSPNCQYSLDPWQDTSLFKSQTPGGSPRSRLI